MDTVLGVSMAPTAVRMVLVEGQNGDGATVDEDNFDVQADDDVATISAADQVVSAIMGTREGAAEGGYQLASTGVTFTDPIEAAALRDALATHKIENVMLVSAFLAAAALAQAVGNQTNYARTALLYIEPDTATLAVVDSADGSVTDVQRQALPDDDEAAVAQLATMVSGAAALETRPDAVFVVGSGIDIPMIKPALEAATTLPLAAAEEPETALARGAALASANAPLFASSTAALAYAQDPGTGAINPFAVAPGYFETPGRCRRGAAGLQRRPRRPGRPLHRRADWRDRARGRGLPRSQVVPAGGRRGSGGLHRRGGGAGRFAGDRDPADRRCAARSRAPRRRAHPGGSRTGAGRPGTRAGCAARRTCRPPLPLRRPRRLLPRRAPRPPFRCPRRLRPLRLRSPRRRRPLLRRR